MALPSFLGISKMNNSNSNSAGTSRLGVSNSSPNLSASGGSGGMSGRTSSGPGKMSAGGRGAAISRRISNNKLENY
jgi:hypothetical protein